jgi:RimJ/RimL family protein N-acetyltransferase
LLPEALSDGVVLLDHHMLADAEAHLRGEDDEMLQRFGAPRRSTIAQTRAAMRRWIDARRAGGPMFGYALRTPERTLMGGCEARWLSDDALTVSYWVFLQFRGNGYAARAATLLCGATAAVPGVARIEAHIDADNIASRHVAEKAGFAQSGVVDGKIQRIRYVRPIGT